MSYIRMSKYDIICYLIWILYKTVCITAYILSIYKSVDKYCTYI